MRNRKIGVLMGGLSSEKSVSVDTGQAILAALQERGYDAQAIFVDRDLDLVLRQSEIDVAFLALHGRYGEDGCIQGMLELMGVPYTGSDVLASGTSADGKTVERRQGLGLPLARQLVEAHGGTLQLMSEPGHGTAAIIDLP